MIEGNDLPTIPAGRVRLRPLADGDVAALFAVFSDEQVMRYWSTPPMREVAEAQALLDDIRARFLQRSLFQWGVARVEADVDPRNAPSIRIVEKLGFVREGLLRGRWHVGGEVQDSVILGLLRLDRD